MDSSVAHSASGQRLPASPKSNAGSEKNIQNKAAKPRLSGVKPLRQPAQTPQKEYVRKRDQKVQFK